jgi:hypothetical protein
MPTLKRNLSGKNVEAFTEEIKKIDFSFLKFL